MSIGIIFVVLAVAMVLGPIMLMKPSGRQRQLAGMRQRALELGLQSRIATVTGGLKHFTVAPTIAIYQKRWVDKRFCPERSLMLVRSSFAHDVHFHGVWDWKEGDVAALSLSQAMSNCLDELPESVLAVEFTPLGVGLYWLEKGAKVDDLLPAFPVLMAWLEEQGLLEKTGETS
ncbi:hypothetical protein [uncultured Pseudoteredinibacter sp.]|uniref:hypothetical protein n=1 Tax=uncultured Pseudoteredinibacter sp. TaxID=1641701 RepID=UPI002613E2C9|nr:hypothetical protein [uncultured Pseudoteredinibacter sp.]